MAAPRGSEVWRDYVTDGIPSSGANKPKKSDIRSWSSWLESLVTSGILSSGPWFATSAAATLNYPENTIAVVYNDPTAANNGLYIKVGASGVGYWTQLTSFLPGYQFVTASPTGASTANAIVASTSPRLPAGDGVALVTLVIPHTNTVSPVTVSFDGASVLTIKTRTGEDPDAGELQQNDVVAGFVSGATFRLISDLNSLRNYQSAKAWANNDEDVPVPASLGGDGVTTFSAKHWAAKSEEDADRSYDEAERAHNEANSAETSAGVAAAIVNDIASEKEVPIVGVVEAMPSIILPTGMTAIRTNGFGTMGDLGAWQLAVEVPNSGDLEAWQRLTNGGGRRWELRADDVSVKMFGAKGDGVTDDAAAIEDALHYWRFTGCTLFFPAGNYRIASGVLLDMSGVVWAGQIIMRGAIKPDPGIGAAITIRNVRGGHYGLAVNGGGQTADYRLADPVGGDESFRFVNCLGGVIDLVRGQNYKGRVLRVTSDTDNLGPDGFRTQGMFIRNCYFGSAAKSTDPEVTRLDQGVGQGFFIDTKAGAFGTIERAWWFWELYGSVVDRTTDMTINDGESLYRGISGLQLRGLISFNGGTLKLGSEMAGFSEPLLTISDSADGVTNTQNSRIRDLFLVGGAIGLSATNVGVSTGQSLDIGHISSRLNTDKGVLLNNCRKMSIGNLASYGDKVGLQISGTSDDLDIKMHIRSSKAQAVIIDAPVTGNIKMAGEAFDGNEDNAADVSLIDVNTVAPVFFNDFIASSAKVDYLYDIVSGNSTSIEGGRVVIAGTTARSRNQPNRVINVRGWATANAGTVTLPASATSVVVPHGLVKAPDTVVLTPRGPLASPPYVSAASRTATEFSIGVATAVASAQPIDWVARCDYGRI